jgi:hypothetical protein
LKVKEPGMAKTAPTPKNKHPKSQKTPSTGAEGVKKRFGPRVTVKDISAPAFY